MQEGVRFAFEGDRAKEDSFVFGSRLPFLLLMTKYSHWIKKNRGQLSVVRDHLLTKEEIFRAHPEFDDVHEDDIDSLVRFKASIGITESMQRAPRSEYEQGFAGGSAAATPSPADASISSRKRMSTGGSKRTRVSNQSNLSPLYESEAEESEDSPSPQKRRKLATTLEHSRIDEEQESEVESSSS